MTFASFSTVTAVFENLIASACDNWGWSRKKSVGIVGTVLFLTSIPCVLGYNVWSGFHPMPGKDILDFEDFLVSSPAAADRFACLSAVLREQARVGL